MNFTISKRYFYEKLSVVARAISVFSPLPAFSRSQDRCQRNTASFLPEVIPISRSVPRSCLMKTTS